MKKAVFERVRMLGGQPANHDESDAWGIAYAACHGRSAAKRVQEDLFAKAVGAL
jgi:Holliday junction resolvasome RuvABC endonuclease subunit